MNKQSHGYRFFSWIFCAIILSLLTSCESQKTIVNGLEEKEANEIIVFLSSKGLDASKVRTAEAGAGGGSRVVLWDIAIKQSQATEAMALLNQAGLPRRRSQNLLGLFSSVGLVPSEMQEQIRYQAGLAEQIASTIRKIDGVLDAEVQVSFPKEDPLNPGATRGRITASVYVKHNGVLDDPNSHLSTRIKRLVSASITGLDYDNVTVIPDRARGSDLTGGMFIENPNDQQLVSIWTVIVARDSVSRFRTIFFTFTLLLLLTGLGLIWMLWKFYPWIKQHGWKEFFKLEPIHPALDNIVKDEAPKVEEKSKEELANRDVDET